MCSTTIPANLLVVNRREHFELAMTAEAKEPWTEEEIDDAVRLYRRGMTIDEVAGGVGRSYSATRRLLMRWGVFADASTDATGQAVLGFACLAVSRPLTPQI
jgi:hypothetical protein